MKNTGDPVPLSATSTVNDKPVYFVQIQMGTTGYSGFTMFTHSKWFKDEEFKSMLSEAATIVNERRIKARRQQMAKNHVPIEDPLKINETWFDTDVAFFEGVMCDKWDFRVLRTHSAQVAIEPTVRI